jgi:hypothetical protein
MAYCYQEESGGKEVESVATQNRATNTLIDLVRDPKGYPLVPQENGNLVNMKGIVRSFITAHYRKFVLFFRQRLAELISLNPRFCFWPETRSGPMEANQRTYREFH